MLHFFRFAAHTGLLLVLTACTRDRATELTQPASGSLSLVDSKQLEKFPPLNAVIAELELPAGVQFDANLSDEALVEAVRRSNGVVSIGLKSPGHAHTRVSGRIPGMTRGQVESSRAMLRARGVELLQTFRNSSTVFARIAPEDAPVLKGLPVVNYIAASQTGTALSGPVRSVGRAASFPQSYAPQDTSWGVHRIGADSVWQQLYAFGENVSVTIVDYGLIQGQYQNASMDGPSVLTDCLQGDAAHIHSCWTTTLHGSFVAGIINARDNEVGYIGIAPALHRFVSINVFGDSPITTDALVSGALDWAISQGWARHIVNLSIGFCFDQPGLLEFTYRASNAGLLVVAGAGNKPNAGGGCDVPPGSILGPQGTEPNGVVWPARYPWVLAVSGTIMSGPTEVFAEAPAVAPCNHPADGGSRFGPQVDLSAPHWAYSMTGNDLWNYLCGTSYAAPHVVGTAALVWSRNPGWSAAEVRDRLIETAADLGPSGYDSKFGFGRVSAMQAASDDPWAPFSVSVYGQTEIEQGATRQWSATVSEGYTGNLTFEWTVNGQTHPETTQMISYNNNGAFLIRVKVTDEAGYFRRARLFVTMNPAADCI